VRRTFNANYRLSPSNSESSTDPESSEEQSLHNRGFSKQLSVHLKNTLSLADLQKLLEEQCPKQYVVMSKRNAFTFEDWNGVKHLRIGEIQNPFDLTSKNVYAYIGGADNNGVRLTQGPANEKLSLVNTNIVELDRPFRDLCNNGRLIDEEEKERLRAVMCFWLLEAGYIHTMKKYDDFEEYLIDACQWLCGAVLAKATRNGEDNSSEISPEDHTPTASGPGRTGDESTLLLRKRKSVSSSRDDSNSLIYSECVHGRTFKHDLTAIQRQANAQSWKML
jgi:hypothetical protein